MNRSFLWVLSLVLAVLLSACDSTKKTDYRDVIPNDAVMTVKVDLGSVLQKSEVLSNPQIKGVMRSGLSSLSRETRDMFEEIMENPVACGIDVQKPMIVSIVNFEQAQGVISLAMSNREQFERFFNTMNDEFAHSRLSIHEKNSMWFIQEGEDSDVAVFDDSKLVFAFANSNPDPMDYVRLRDSRHALTDTRFDGFFADNSDMTVFLDLEQCARLVSYMDMDVVDMREIASLCDDATSLFSLDFEAGAIRLSCALDGNEDFHRFCETLYRHPNGKNLPQVPANSFLMLNMGLGNLSSILPLLSPDLRSGLRQGFANVGLDESVLDSFDGDLTIAFASMEEILLMAQCQNSDFFDAISTPMALNLQAVPVAERAFNVEGFCYGCVDDRLFVLSSSLYEQGVQNGRFMALSDNFSGNRFSSLSSGNFFVLDVKKALDFAVEIGLNYDRDYRIAEPFLRYVDNVSLCSDDVMTSTLTLEFSDKHDNALKQIVNLAVATVVRQMLR